jgi:hypothetical protein
MSRPTPQPPEAPEGRPRGDERDLEACRAAVERADKRGVGGLLMMLFVLALVGAGAAGVFVAAQQSLATWLRGPGAFTALAPAPPPAKKAAPAPPPTTLTPPAAEEFAK